MMTTIFMGEEEEVRRVLHLGAALVAKVLVVVVHNLNMVTRILDLSAELVHKE